MLHPTTVLTLTAALALTMGARAGAAPPDPPATGGAAGSLALRSDASDRLTIPVYLNGQGPFPFVIDTGADRTVISTELARALNLPAGPLVSLTSSGGVDTVDTALIAALTVGGRADGPIDAPLLTAANLGAVGMLGIDVLRDQHVTLDFRARRLSSSESRRPPEEATTIVVRGKSRFGQLILMDATVRGVPVMVILDSGAQSSVGNPALERILKAVSRQGDGQAAKVISVTGRETPAAIREVADAQVGGLKIHNIPLAFADLHTFRRFGLTDQPAMLLGMDVLRLCGRVTVDFKRREASFTLD